MTVHEFWSILGLEPGSSRHQIIEARRQLSLIHHPDRGGSVEVMAGINRAADELLAAIGRQDTASPTTSSDPLWGEPGKAVITVDRPSFTIDVLPVEAFEYVLLAAVALGELGDDDPPYGLDTIVRGWPTSGIDTFCRFELVPDAGATTVSIVAVGNESSMINVENLRDLFVSEINGLVTTRPSG
ncbi:MAG: hypothetical protein ACO276_10445 [Ilumatobacteraceae bacterium]